MGYQDEDEPSEEGFLEMLADYEKLSKLQEDSPVSLAGSLWYTRNETMGTLSFLLPLSSSPGAAPEGSAP